MVAADRFNITKSDQIIFRLPIATLEVGLKAERSSPKFSLPKKSLCYVCLKLKAKEALKKISLKVIINSRENHNWGFLCKWFLKILFFS